MRVLISAAVVAASVWTTAASAACMPTRHQACVDLTVPDLANQVLGPDKPAPRAQRDAPVTPKDSYTGPTVGVTNTVRRAPEIGYRWAIN